MWATILSLAAGLVGILTYFLVKTPAQQEQDHLEDMKEYAAKLAAAAKKAADEKNPEDLSKLINQ